jgi:hypothetical protein
MCYRLDGNENSVTKEFFLDGNKKNHEKYNSQLPWLQEPKGEMIGPGITLI